MHREYLIKTTYETVFCFCVIKGPLFSIIRLRTSLLAKLKTLMYVCASVDVRFLAWCCPQYL